MRPSERKNRAYLSRGAISFPLKIIPSARHILTHTLSVQRSPSPLNLLQGSWYRRSTTHSGPLTALSVMFGSTGQLCLRPRAHRFRTLQPHFCDSARPLFLGLCGEWTSVTYSVTVLLSYQLQGSLVSLAGALRGCDSVYWIYLSSQWI